jgi:hypothetical protein
MLGSEAPPWRTITFAGGQLAGVPADAVAAGTAFTGAEPEPAEPALAAPALLQLEGITFFWRRGCLATGGRFGLEDVCTVAGAAAAGLDEGDGFCVGGGVSWSWKLPAVAGLSAACGTCCFMAPAGNGAAGAGRRMLTRRIASRVIPGSEAVERPNKLILRFPGAESVGKPNPNLFHS